MTPKLILPDTYAQVMRNFDALDGSHELASKVEQLNELSRDFPTIDLEHAAAGFPKLADPSDPHAVYLEEFGHRLAVLMGIQPETIEEGRERLVQEQE